MRILALMKYGREAASTRQRLLQYEPWLKSAGFDITVETLLDDSYVRGLVEGRRAKPLRVAKAYASRAMLLARYQDYDALWIHYEVFPYFPSLFERLAFWSGKPVIFDYDDAIFHTYDAHRSTIVRKLLGSKLKPLISGASLVLAGNEYLADYARHFDARTEIVPTVVDTEIYRPSATARGRDQVVVGWIGSPSTWPYVEQRLPAILSAVRTHGATLRAVGAGTSAESLAIETSRWSEANEVADVQAMDIGIMPLPDELWTRGKCGYKLIQYMACGLPVIASPVGVNREIVRHGVNGFLAETDAEWHVALAQLIGSAELRGRLGATGRNDVVARYSLHVQAPRLIRFLQDTVRRA